MATNCLKQNEVILELRSVGAPGTTFFSKAKGYLGYSLNYQKLVGVRVNTLK